MAWRGGADACPGQIMSGSLRNRVWMCLGYRIPGTSCKSQETIAAREQPNPPSPRQFLFTPQKFKCPACKDFAHLGQYDVEMGELICGVFSEVDDVLCRLLKQEQAA